MIEYIKKRDGKVVKFDKDKIVNAIIPAMKDAGEIDYEAAINIASDIADLDVKIGTVECIQDKVEEALMKEFPKVARAYITYRNERSRRRRMKSDMMKMVKEKAFATNVVNSNANVDEYSFGGRKNEAAGIIQKEIGLEILDPDVREYREKNLLYIHDFTEYPIGDHNCLFADTGKLTTNGFNTRNGGVRGARSFSTACQQIAVIFQIQSQCQYGGVGSARIDDDLAPFVRMSFLKHYEEGLTYCQHVKGKNYESFVKKYKKVLDTASINAEINIFKQYSKPAYVYAIDMLEKEGHQSTEALYHNLNTLESRPGSQLPFTSINFGLNTTFEGRCVSRWMMNASIAGIGEFHQTPIFPISIFKFKKDINDRPGTPNYDLFQLAVKSLSMRIYPNIVNCDWTSNKPDEHPIRMISTNGIDKRNKVSVVIGNVLYCQPVSELYKIVANCNVIKTEYGSVKDLRPLNILIEDDESMYSDYIHHVKGAKDDATLTIGRTKINFIAKLDNGRYAITTESFKHIYYTQSGKRTYYVSDMIEKAHAYDSDTEMATMGCRTMIGYDRFDMGYKKTGRGNVSPATMILPKLGIEYGICLGKRKKADVEGFFKAFHKLLEVTEKSLVDRFNYICSQNIKAGWFMYENGNIYDGEKAAKSGNVYDAMKHGTLALGYIGIANTCYAMFGKYHDQSQESLEFADRIINTIKQYADEASERNNLNFSTYSTPAEGACFTICKNLQKEYGKIKGVTDREYLTNSLHVPVFEEVSIKEKIDIESKLARYSTGGEINYVELESSVVHNRKAVESIIKYGMEANIPYLAINFPIDTCQDCGKSVGEMDDTCPFCGGHNISSLRRVTGYLTTDYHKFNKGKQSEVHDRVKHSKYTNFKSLKTK